MRAQVLTPDPQYLRKLWLIITLIAAGVVVFTFLLAWLIGLDGDASPREIRVMIIIFLIADAAWWLPAMLLIGPYYRSLRYEIRDDEVVVYVGIWTKSVKHVPYRTVTNLKVKRDIIDRFVFDIGSLNIQTAGMSGKTGAEESLVGLVNVPDIYEAVARKLRQYRGSMSPTAADMEQDAPAVASSAVGELLSEVRAIRKAIENK